MARFQIGETMKPGDKRIAGVVRALATVKSCRFVVEFYDKYRERYHLPTLDWLEDLRIRSQAPSESLRSQKQEQEQEQEHIKRSTRATPCVRWSRVLLVMTGSRAASGGKSHSWVTATSLS